MKRLRLATHSPQETLDLGIRLGKLAQPGYIILLSGPLGAGKTCFTQGIARGLGSQEYALSPTFVLVREIKGRLPLYHIDLYRLDRIEEIVDLGLHEYLFGQGLTVIEWAEKGSGMLPAEHLWINVGYISDNERSFEFIPSGKQYDKLLKRLFPPQT